MSVEDLDLNNDGVFEGVVIINFVDSIIIDVVFNIIFNELVVVLEFGNRLEENFFILFIVIINSFNFNIIEGGMLG